MAKLKTLDRNLHALVNDLATRSLKLFAQASSTVCLRAEMGNMSQAFGPEVPRDVTPESERRCLIRERIVEDVEAVSKALHSWFGVG